MHKRKMPVSSEAPVILVPQLLTIDQVAAALSMGRSTVYDLINEEGLPYVLVRGTKRVPAASLDWWIAHHMCSTNEEINERLRRNASQMDERGHVSIEMDQSMPKTKSSPRKRQAPRIE